MVDESELVIIKLIEEPVHSLSRGVDFNSFLTVLYSLLQKNAPKTMEKLLKTLSMRASELKEDLNQFNKTLASIQIEGNRVSYVEQGGVGHESILDIERLVYGVFGLSIKDPGFYSFYAVLSLNESILLDSFVLYTLTKQREESAPTA